MVTKGERVQITDENGKEPGEEGYIPTYSQGQTMLEVVYGDGKSVGPFSTGYDVRTGDYVKVILSSNGSAFMHCEKLTELDKVPNSAWSGQSAVTVGGRTYKVSEDVPCFNRSTGRWMSLSAAHG